MNHKSYKNIAFALALTCLIQTTDLRSVFFENVTGTAEELEILAANHRRAKLIKEVKKTLKHNKQLDKQIAKFKKEREVRILPFATDKEMQEKYMELWEREKILFDPENKDVSQTDKDQYQNDLISFYQRLFRSIVKRDIEKKAKYTIALGLKVAGDGSLTMERLPLEYEDMKKQNELLFKLSANPLDKDSVNALKELDKKRKNPTKSADPFFPELVVTTEKVDYGWAYYAGLEKKIYIYPTNLLLRDHYSLVALHEFRHRLQFAESDACGGLVYRPLMKSPTKNYPQNVLIEIEAELGSVSDLPYPEKYLDVITTGINKFYEGHFHDAPEDYYTMGSTKTFPYLDLTQRYAQICETHNLPKNQQYSKNLANWTVAMTIKNKTKELFPEYYNLVKYNKKSDSDLAEKTDNFKKELLNKNNLTEEQKNKIDSASNKSTGKKKFFKLKQNLGLIPK